MAVFNWNAFLRYLICLPLSIYVIHFQLKCYVGVFALLNGLHAYVRYVVVTKFLVDVIKRFQIHDMQGVDRNLNWSGVAYHLSPLIGVIVCAKIRYLFPISRYLGALVNGSFLAHQIFGFPFQFYTLI